MNVILLFLVLEYFLLFYLISKKKNLGKKTTQKFLNRMLKMILCALEIRKHFESKKCLKIKIGISYGECKFIILDNKGNTNYYDYSIVNKHSFKNIEFIMSDNNNKYIFNINNLFLNTNNNLHFFYFLLGKSLGDCCKYSKIGEESQITIDQNIYNYISDYIEVEEVETFERTKLYKVIRQIQSLKLQKNISSYISKLNYFDKLIISKKIILNFAPNFIFRT